MYQNSACGNTCCNNAIGVTGMVYGMHQQTPRCLCPGGAFPPQLAPSPDLQRMQLQSQMQRNSQQLKENFAIMGAVYPGRLASCEKIVGAT